MFLWGGIETLRDRLGEWLPEGSLRARFARGTFWAATGVVVAQVLAMAASVLVARIFGEARLYGELSMIRINVMTFGVFAGLSLGLMTTKYVAELRESDPARAGRIMGLATVVGLVTTTVVSLALVFLAPTLATWIKRPHLVMEIRLSSLLLFFEALNGLQTGALSGFEAFKKLARLSLIRGLLYFPIVVAAVYLGRELGGVDSPWQLRAAVLGLALTSALGCLINAVALRRLARARGVTIRYRGIGAEARVIWFYALPAFGAGVLQGGALWLANILLVRTARTPEVGYGFLGVFNAANQWQLPVTFLAVQFQATLLPMLSSFGTLPDRRRERKLQDATFHVLTLVVLPSVAFLACFANPIMALYGRGFRGDPAMMVLCAALFVGGAKAFGTLAGTAIASRGVMWSGLALNAAWGVALLAFVGLWVDHGVVGFANAFSASYVVSTVLGLGYCASRGLCSWTLAGRVGFVTVLLGAFSYGMAFIGPLPWPVRGGAFLAAVAVSGAIGWHGWRQYRGAPGAPGQGSEPPASR